jgi:hypothetical protein
LPFVGFQGLFLAADEEVEDEVVDTELQASGQKKNASQEGCHSLCQ